MTANHLSFQLKFKIVQLIDEIPKNKDIFDKYNHKSIILYKIYDIKRYKFT